jgi:hypothetical protein
MRTLSILHAAAAGVAATISVGAGVAAAARTSWARYIHIHKDAKNTIQGTGAAVIVATRAVAVNRATE